MSTLDEISPAFDGITSEDARLGNLGYEQGETLPQEYHCLTIDHF
jgi:hypothetical protein